jgi:hypothetical protein
VTRRSQPNTLVGRSVRALARALALLAFLILAPPAHASKQPVDFFGGEGTLGGQFTDAEGVAVNDSGAGGVPAGTIYVTDGGDFDASDARGNRVERFQRNDNGTPGDAADDTYSFVAAWGAGVLTGGTDYEICTEAANCQKGTGQGGNGTVAGNGSLNKPSSIAVDEETGEVYVLDASSRRTLDDHYRINVYSATGAFLRSFGWDVVESGSGNTGTGFEVCVAADGDVCKKGTKGAGLGQLGSSESGERAAESLAVSPPDGNPSTGTVYVADQFNRRVNTYGLDGSSPGAIGSSAQFDTNQPTDVAVDSRGILYATNHTGPEIGGNNPIERYDTANANGGGVSFLTPIKQGVDEVQELTVSATSGTFNLGFEGDTTPDLPFNASSGAVQEATRALSSVNGPNLSVNGGPGGSSPYKITFQGGLGSKDVPQLVCSNGSVPLSGGSGCSVTTSTSGVDGLTGSSQGLAVDPDEDGAGPEADVLYASRGGVIEQFGPTNAPGLTAPPGADEDRHATSGTASPQKIAVEPSTGRLYTATFSGLLGRGVYAIDDVGATPTATLDSVDGITTTSAELHATIDPNGPPATRYRFEYVDNVAFQESGFAEAKSTEQLVVGAQEDPQAVDYHFEPPAIGLQPGTTYHVRLIAGRALETPAPTVALTFTTLGSPPLAETAGAPVRTTASAQLNGRVTPRNSATTYHFEYGTTEAYGQSTPASAAGADGESHLVAAEIEGLEPDTTYHYRLVADNGVGSPVAGEDMTAHTRASDELLGQSDEFPGPPGSDRAWEQISLGDSSGNPVAIFFTYGFSDNGNRAIYGVAGGTPISVTGSFISPYLSERTPSGWQPIPILPPRDQLAGQIWGASLTASADLSSILALNKGADLGVEEQETWHLGPGAVPVLVHRADETEPASTVSADGSRQLAVFSGGSLDPAYPAAAAKVNVYDVSSGSPHLVSLLPGELVGPCGTTQGFSLIHQDSNWLSADGSLAYFGADPAAPCQAEQGTQLYLRDIPAAQTKLISGPPLSGPDCAGSLIKAVPGAVFFATAGRLDPADLQPPSCGGAAFNDVYRYQLSDGSLRCVTCLVPGFEASVEGVDSATIGVAEDGSRVYFTTSKRLLPGALPEGQAAIYRVEVASGELAYVAPSPAGGVGTASSHAAFSADGSVLVFSSDSTALNPLGGTADNGGGTQYYRYDDRDRSLICASCPQDGSAPAAEVEGVVQAVNQSNNNNYALSDDGGTFAFATPVSLVGADQNTPGPDHSPETGNDVYEWRDGRQVLVTDGLTNWSENANGSVSSPQVKGVSPSGRDVYFLATAAYTADAPDALLRLYDARIGGGFHFPTPPPPCPLEVCQGTPKGAPEEQEPASRNFSGPGNLRKTTARPCPKGKRKVRRAGKARCTKPRKPNRRRANHNRRAHR